MIRSNNLSIIETLSSICVRNLDKVFLRAIANANSQLIDKLQHLSDAEQSEFSVAINLLESNLAWMVDRLTLDALNGLRPDESSPDSSPDSDDAHCATEDYSAAGSCEASSSSGKDEEVKATLSLVSKGDFEEWLLVDVSKKKLERELDSDLGELCLVFSELHDTDVSTSDIPIGPNRLMNCLKALVDELEIPSFAQTTIYRAVTSTLEEDLARLYSELLAQARRDGVDTEQAFRRQQANKDIFGSQSELNSRDTGAHDSDSDASDQETQNSVTADPRISSAFERTIQEGLASERRYSSISTLSRLGAMLNGDKQTPSKLDDVPKHDRAEGTTVSQPEEGSGPHSNDFNGDFEVHALLSGIRALSCPNLSNVSGNIQSIKSWLATEHQAGHISTESLTDNAEELVDVTDSLFLALANEKQGNQTLERWLGKLKIVIFKSVLSDQSFFSNHTHPSRQMLNRLGDLADIVEAGHTRLEHLLERAIDKVVADYRDDVTPIVDVVAELTALFDRHVAAYQRNTERVALSYDGKQRVASVRHRVVNDIRVLIGQEPFPHILVDLLDDAGWREHMALCAIRDGFESESYVQSVQVLEQLCEWLCDLAELSEELVQDTIIEIGVEAPFILEGLKRELTAINASKAEAVVARLNAALSGHELISLVNIVNYDWPFSESESEIRDLMPTGKVAKGRTRWHKQLMSIKRGDWLQLIDDDGEKRLLRLAWSGSESLRFVFVDSQGMKDEDLSIDELAQLMAVGHAFIVEPKDVPLVDQGIHRMVQSVYEDLSTQSNCDPLTGLLTRQALERALDQTVAKVHDVHASASFVCLDIDNFNVTNSTYGLPAGDDVLRHVASVLRENVRSDSYCGRLGGNEFALVLMECDSDDAIEIAQRIQSSLLQTPPAYQGNDIPTELSAGVVEIDRTVDDYDSILRKGEFACRQAKQSNTETVVVYELQTYDERRRDETLKWVNKLDTCLDNLLSLRVQEIRPILCDGNASHWEILLGVALEGQVIPPGPLIDAAESYGKMKLVDRWVVENALGWMNEHEDFVLNSGGFSINLSGQSLSDDQFLDFVEQQIDEKGVQPSKICFEITETSAIVNIDFASEFIRVLRAKGCRFSLDDFGTGLSSYAYIQKLPVDFIKIDGMFVRNLAKSDTDRALVQSINELAHFMGIETVAEFVENNEVLGILEEIGVDHSQGYGIRKPIPISDLLSVSAAGAPELCLPKVNEPKISKPTIAPTSL